MFIALYHSSYGTEFHGGGSTLKAAFDELKEKVDDASEKDTFNQEDVEFFEGKAIQVEFLIVKKEVVQAVVAAPKPVARKKA